jgi:hypothetical protein
MNREINSMNHRRQNRIDPHTTPKEFLSKKVQAEMARKHIPSRRERLIAAWEELNQKRSEVPITRLWPVLRDMIRIRIVLFNRYNYTVGVDL